MSQTTMSVEAAALLLLETAKEHDLADFPRLAEEMLEDASPGEIEAIGQLIPPVLRELLPKRTLH